MACLDKIVIYVITLMFVILVYSGLSGAESLTVNRAQVILKKMNYYPDAVTGTMSAATVKSIVTFQTDYNLKPTGKLDEPTCRALLAEDKRISSAAERDREQKTVTEAQTRLKALFYYFGPVNGTRSDIPKSALSDFQKDNNLQVTETLDEKTMNLLTSVKAQARKPVDISAHPVKPAPVPPPLPAENKEKKADNQVKPVVVKKVEPSEKEDKKKDVVVQPLWNLSLGHMTYKPRSGYDSTSYEAVNETLHPAQAVVYDEESFTMARLAVDYAPFRAALATSRLAGGDNAADALSLAWYVNLKKKPFILSFHYESMESDALTDGRIVGIETRTVEGEWLYRHKPWMSLGLGVSYGTWPTLVSCKNSQNRDRDIGFDKDFKLATVDAVLRFDSLSGDRRPLFKIEHLYPYVSGSFFAGLGYGTVSDDVINRLSTDLGHAFSGTVTTVHVKLSPEVGLTYQLHRPGFDVDVTVGYALSVTLPNLALHRIPGFETDDEVEFYRRNVSHGVVLGGNVSF